MRWIASSPSQSPPVTAPPKGEPLAKPGALPYCQSLSPSGEVAATGGSRRRGRGCCPQPCRWRFPLKTLSSGEVARRKPWRRGFTPHCPAPQLIYQFDILVCPHYRQRGKAAVIYQSKCRTCFFCAIDISVAFPFFSPPCRPRPVCRLPPPGPKKPKFTNLLQLSLFFLDASQFSMQNVEVYMLHSFSAEVYSFQQ